MFRKPKTLGGRLNQVYPILSAFFKAIAPTWRKTQLDNLTALSAALLFRKTLCVAQLAKSHKRKQKAKVKNPKHVLLHKVKRVRRFLDNPRLDVEAIFTRLTTLSFSVCRSPGLLLPVLLDPTTFGDYRAIVAAFPRSGRALPLAWRVIRCDLDGESELSQNLIVRKLVGEVVERLHGVVQMVLVADREFASAEFFRFLKGLGTRFVIRVDKETWILSPDYEGPLGGLPIKPGGKKLWFEGALYAKEQREPVNLLVVWASQQKEPWFIATNLDDRRLVERLYRKRMKIEHGFRDWKHHLRLKGTLRVQSATRAGTLITVVALVYWFISLVGRRLNRPNHRAKVSYWGQASDFTIGLELLQMRDEAALRAAHRILNWLDDKLLALAPWPRRYQLRYLRFRPWLLPQSGSP